jgi:hypothetical protein
VGADESLLLRWFDSEISPLLERHQVLSEASLRRKIAALAESVATSLETFLLHGGAQDDRQVKAGLAEARRLFDQAATTASAGRGSRCSTGRCSESGFWS